MIDAKIVLIGAGSASFGLGILSDIFRDKRFAGSRLSLCDKNLGAAKTMAAIANRMGEASGVDLDITHTDDQRDVLRDADYVIMSIEVERYKRWRMDWEIPFKHGIRQVLGENGGPGGLFHAMRNIPPILSICADMRDLCPGALAINFTNPVSKVTLAASRHGRVRVLGLCHGLGGLLGTMERIVQAKLWAVAGGLNHFTWISKLLFSPSSGDAYPALRSKLADLDGSVQPLSREMFRVFGLYPSCDDSHIAEYLPTLWVERSHPWELERDSFWRPNFEARDQNKEADAQRTLELATGRKAVDVVLQRGSGERAIAIIAAIEEGIAQKELAVNVPNEGLISNIPRVGVVEIPALVKGGQIRPSRFGRLPAAIACLCAGETYIQDLTVEAGVSGDEEKAVQAIAVSPSVGDYDLAEAIFADMLAAHRDLLPQFSCKP
jgi:alpha-galactosidase